MRATRIGFTAFGWAAVVAGVGCGVGAAVAGGVEAQLTLGILAATLLVLGIVFVLVARYMAGLDTSDILRGGVPGVAQVLSTRDTGTVVNNVNLVVELGLQVSLPGQAPYNVTVRHVQQGRTQWGSIQPGMVVAVKVDPHDPSKVAVDPEGADSAGAAAMAAGAFGGGGGWSVAPGTAGQASPSTGGQGAPQPVATGGMPADAPHGSPISGLHQPGQSGAGQTEVVPVSAADIVARGVATHGTIESAAPTGMTAGQVAGGLAPHEADDPVMQIAFTYVGPGGQQMRQQALMRVPDGKAGYLTAGTGVSVAYLPDMPQRATIDWSRLGAGPII